MYRSCSHLLRPKRCLVTRSSSIGREICRVTPRAATLTSGYHRTIIPESPFIPAISRHYSGQPAHDMGGRKETFGPINAIPDNLQPWEQTCHALMALLASKGYFSTDMFRYKIESLAPVQYEQWSYYERWIAAMTTLLLESNVIRYDDVATALFGKTQAQDKPKFQPGDSIRILSYHQQDMQWRRPHLRTPGYAYGVCGTVVDVCGQFPDPSLLAFGITDAPSVWLYRVHLSLADLWPEQTQSEDVIKVEIYEHWLEASSNSRGHDFAHVPLLNHDGGDGSDCTSTHHHHNHDHDHHRHHDHDHVHEERPVVEQTAKDREGPPRPGKALLDALLKILVDQGTVTYTEVHTMIEGLEVAGDTLHGASLVVQAWTDDDFKQRLLENPAAAAAELGIATSNPNAPTVLSVVENTPETHNLVVCTLCSCYPSGLLGIAPSWYKSSEFRSRAVREPRRVLEEFGTTLPAEQSVTIHDSTADHRYLVLPQKPTGVDDWTRDELRSLISRDSMIGVRIPTR